MFSSQNTKKANILVLALFLFLQPRTSAAMDNTDIFCNLTDGVDLVVGSGAGIYQCYQNPEAIGRPWPANVVTVVTGLASGGAKFNKAFTEWPQVQGPKKICQSSCLCLEGGCELLRVIFGGKMLFYDPKDVCNTAWIGVIDAYILISSHFRAVLG